MNILGPAMAGVGALGQINQGRNAGQQQQGYNQILSQQAMQQMQQAQAAMPAYNQILDFYSKRAGLGNYTPGTAQPMQQDPMDQSQMWKPFEIGGEKYHGLGSRLKKPAKKGALTGQGDGDAKRMYGAGDPNGMLRRNQQQVPGTGQGGPMQQAPNPLGQQGWGSRRNIDNPLAPPASTNRTGGASDQQLGIWNNPEDRMRLMAAQDDIDRYQGQQGNQLRHNLAQRGLLDSGAYGAGLERLGSNALQQFADFRRQMAIGAGTEEERRIANFMNALAPGMNMGAPAANTFSQLGSQAGQQQAASNQSLQGLFQLFGQLFGPQPGQVKTPSFGGSDGRSSNYGGGLGGIR
jgi:hypothetical protein